MTIDRYHLYNKRHVIYGHYLNMATSKWLWLVSTHFSVPVMIINTVKCRYFVDNFAKYSQNTTKNSLPGHIRRPSKALANWMDQPAITGCATVSTVNKLFAITSYALLMVHVFRNLVYHFWTVNLKTDSTITKHHPDYVASHSSLRPGGCLQREVPRYVVASLWFARVPASIRGCQCKQ